MRRQTRAMHTHAHIGDRGALDAVDRSAAVVCCVCTWSRVIRIDTTCCLLLMIMFVSSTVESL